MPKYWGKQTFTHGKFPQSGPKAKDREKQRKRREKVGNNNGQLRIATPPPVAHAKLPGPRFSKVHTLSNSLEWTGRNKEKSQYRLTQLHTLHV